jgi:hypothetical protein
MTVVENRSTVFAFGVGAKDGHTVKAATSHVKPQYWIRLESVPADWL